MYKYVGPACSLNVTVNKGRGRWDINPPLPISGLRQSKTLGNMIIYRLHNGAHTTYHIKQQRTTPHHTTPHHTSSHLITYPATILYWGARERSDWRVLQNQKISLWESLGQNTIRNLKTKQTL